MDMYQQEQVMRQEEHMMFEQKQQQQQTYEQHTQQQQQQQRVSLVAEDQETYFREREEDSQAPPDLEPVEVQQGFQLGGMGQFGDEGYEPSADELIDVLKNLENLAAGNPSLYRSIVDQIKVANLSESGRDTPNYDKIPEVNGKISTLLATSVKNAKITKN